MSSVVAKVKAEPGTIASCSTTATLELDRVQYAGATGDGNFIAYCDVCEKKHSFRAIEVIETMTEQNGHDFTLAKGRVKSIGHERHDRISDDAALQVLAEEEQRIREVWDTAAQLAEHAGRHTIQEKDVRLAYTLNSDL